MTKLQQFRSEKNRIEMSKQALRKQKEKLGVKHLSNSEKRNVILDTRFNELSQNKHKLDLFLEKKRKRRANTEHVSFFGWGVVFPVSNQYFFVLIHVDHIHQSPLEAGLLMIFNMFTYTCLKAW